MARSRLQKTPADYVAVAISPLLITTLVGSLVFFLLELLYAGRHEGRLQWVMFWFVPASVLVSRIAIEQGPEHAAAFGLALAAATTLVMFQLVGSFIPGAIMLLGLIWWSTSKLTWDCTLIDDSEDASGQGLLDVAGFGDDAFANEAEPDPFDDGAEGASFDRKANHAAKDVPVSRSGGRSRTASSDTVADAESPQARTHTSLWQRILFNRFEREGRVHAPGLWVVYFSLAALPVFGIGRLMIPAEQVDSRQYAFNMLFVYVASALGLFLTTSFLGLRRYLRQRRLAMPAVTTGWWVATGTALIVVILLLCILLPRPSAQYSLTGMLDSISSPDRKASSRAMMKDDGVKGKGEPGEKTERDNRQEASRQRDDAGKQADGEGNRNEPSGEQQQDQQGDQQPSESTSDAGKQQQNRTSQQRGDRQGEAQNDKPQSNGQSRSDDQRQANNRDNESQQPDRNAQRDQQHADAQSDQTQKDARSEDTEGDSAESSSSNREPSSSPSRMPDLSEISGGIAQIAKWLIYAAIAIAVAVVAWRNRAALIASLHGFLQQLRNLLTALFGGRPSSPGESDENENAATSPSVRSFGSFANPFSSGRAETMANSQLVAYTFEALEAWARDHQVGRGAEQTPLEFMRMLTRDGRVFGDELCSFTHEYTRLAYSGRSPSDEARAAARTLWQQMSRTVAAADVSG